MRRIILSVLLLTATLAQAQVYAPGGSLCLPETYWSPNGPVTVVVCR